MSENYVIIGNGGAAMECIKAARENGYKGEITLVSDALYPAYNPMLVTYFASGKAAYDTLFPYGNNLNFYTSMGVRLYLGSPVVNLNTENKTVENAKGLKFITISALLHLGHPLLFQGPLKK